MVSGGTDLPAFEALCDVYPFVPKDAMSLQEDALLLLGPNLPRKSHHVTRVHLMRLTFGLSEKPSGHITIILLVIMLLEEAKRIGSLLSF